MKYFVRAYLRASTTEQDAERAKDLLDRFAAERGLTICNYYIENESGARLDRPALFRLLADCKPHDVLLIEDVDRLSRLKADEWEKLKSLIRKRDVRVVAVNVPTTWQHLSPAQNEFDARMFGAINDMLLDMLAAIARRDYEQRRERQAQGIAKAKSAGKYRGRQINKDRYAAIHRMLASGSSWSMVQRTIGCSRSTISSAVKYVKSMEPKTTSTFPYQKESQSKIKSVTTTLWFHIENGSKFTRGKKRAIENVDDFLQSYLHAEKMQDSEYRIVFQYEDDADLKNQIEEMLDEIHSTADHRNCGVVDYSLTDENKRHWEECDGIWVEC